MLKVGKPLKGYKQETHISGFLSLAFKAIAPLPVYQLTQISVTEHLKS